MPALGPFPRTFQALFEEADTLQTQLAGGQACFLHLDLQVGSGPRGQEGPWCLPSITPGGPRPPGQDQAYLFLEALWGFPSNSRLSVRSCCQLGGSCSFFTTGSHPGRAAAVQAAASLNIRSRKPPRGSFVHCVTCVCVHTYIRVCVCVCVGIFGCLVAKFMYLVAKYMYYKSYNIQSTCNMYI